MLVALRLVEGPTVLSLARLPESLDSPDLRAIQRAFDCVLDDDMHVAVETSWGRAVFRLRDDLADEEGPWLGLYPRVTIHRENDNNIVCTMGRIARNAAWNCLHVLHPTAWEMSGGKTPGSPTVLAVDVVVERRHRIWPSC